MSDHSRAAARSESDPGFSFSEDKPMKAPMKFWFALMVIVAAGATAWAYNTFTVSNTVKRMDKVENEQSEIVKEQRSMRILIERIDANVGAMKEAASRK